MNKNTITVLLVAALAFPGTVLSQQHHPQGGAQPSQGGAMMSAGPGMMGMMTGRALSAAMILEQKVALGLTEVQVQQLEGIGKEFAEARAGHIGRMAPLGAEVNEALEGDRPDFSEYESTLEKMAEEHVRMQVETARLSHGALQVLDPEQRSNLRYGTRLMRQMMGGGMTVAGMANASGPVGAAGCSIMRAMSHAN